MSVGLEPGGPRPAKTFDVLRAPLAIAVTLLAALLGAHALLSARRAEAACAKFLTAKDGACQQATTLLLKIETTYFRDVKGLEPASAAAKANAVIERIPRDEGYVNSVLDELGRRYRELEAEWGPEKDVPPIESALKVWVEIYAAMNGIDRPLLGWCRIAGLNITQTRATLAIEVDDEAAIDRIVKALAGNAYLRARAKDPKAPVSRESFAKNQATGRYAGTVGIDFGGG
jgi:hypothetical protein